MGEAKGNGGRFSSCGLVPNPERGQAQVFHVPDTKRNPNDLAGLHSSYGPMTVNILLLYMPDVTC